MGPNESDTRKTFTNNILFMSFYLSFLLSFWKDGEKLQEIRTRVIAVRGIRNKGARDYMLQHVGRILQELLVRLQRGIKRGTTKSKMMKIKQIKKKTQRTKNQSKSR